jgi:hypothetical protein
MNTKIFENDSDISEKTSGFGIGELGSVPVSTTLDELEAERIDGEQQISWSEHCWRESSCVDCEIERGLKIQISRRVYFSNTMGCKVMCEQCWIKYHIKSLDRVSNLSDGATFEMIMAEYRRLDEIEASRVKHCTRCGSTNASWNSGAGQELCPRHWDEY